MLVEVQRLLAPLLATAQAHGSATECRQEHVVIAATVPKTVALVVERVAGNDCDSLDIGARTGHFHETRGVGSRLLDAVRTLLEAFEIVDAIPLHEIRSLDAAGHGDRLAARPGIADDLARVDLFPNREVGEDLVRVEVGRMLDNLGGDGGIGTGAALRADHLTNAVHAHARALLQHRRIAGDAQLVH